MAEKISFEARPEEPSVQWVGPDDQSTTDLCTEIKREVGSGVPVSEIEDIVERVAEKYDYGTPDRADELVPHFQCRHQINETETNIYLSPPRGVEMFRWCGGEVLRDIISGLHIHGIRF